MRIWPGESRSPHWPCGLRWRDPRPGGRDGRASPGGVERVLGGPRKGSGAHPRTMTSAGAWRPDTCSWRVRLAIQSGERGHSSAPASNSGRRERQGRRRVPSAARPPRVASPGPVAGCSSWLTWSGARDDWGRRWRLTSPWASTPTPQRPCATSPVAGLHAPWRPWDVLRRPAGCGKAWPNSLSVRCSACARTTGWLFCVWRGKTSKGRARCSCSAMPHWPCSQSSTRLRETAYGLPWHACVRERGLEREQGRGQGQGRPKHPNTRQMLHLESTEGHSARKEQDFFRMESRANPFQAPVSLGMNVV